MSSIVGIETDDVHDEVEASFADNLYGAPHAGDLKPRTLSWYLEAERYRYQECSPWMPEMFEFARYAGKQVLEIGGGIGTDLVQFAREGAKVTGLDVSTGYLALAQENFRLRGLEGRFVRQDAGHMPFENASFDLVYANCVLDHTPNSRQVVGEMHRVLKPGGRVIVVVHAENSLHYWRNLVLGLGLREGLLVTHSIGHILSRFAEVDRNGSDPLVKVYTRGRLRSLFAGYVAISIAKRQMVAAEVPRILSGLKLSTLGRLLGWNLILKARKAG